jgi:putative hydrolase of the HAD superfamily
MQPPPRAAPGAPDPGHPDPPLSQLPPMLVAVGGQVASGKSTVAQRVGVWMGATRIEADRVRERLAHGDDALLLAPETEDAVYEEMLRQAAALLSSGQAVVLDGCFPLVDQREWARRTARERGCLFLFVECRVDAETARARLAAREEPGEEGAWLAIHDELAARWEPTDDLAGPELLVLDCGRPLDENDARLHARLERIAASAPVESGNRGSSAAAHQRLSRVEAFTFDCWGTLLVERDWPTAHARRVEAVLETAREARREISRAEATGVFDSAWSRHMQLWDEGVASGAPEIADWCLETLGVAGEGPRAHLIAHFEEASHSGRVTALPGALHTLTALQRAGVRCGLVCDTGLTPGRVVRKHLEREGLLGYLEALAFSDEVGEPKPGERIFRAALGGLHVSPERAAHVGDLRAHDVAGARRLGMLTIRIRAHYDDASALEDADFVVDDHERLAELLRAASGAG